MVRKFLLIILLILLPCSAWATNYYISAAGSGEACSSESPCALATAVAAAGNGDTIFFKSDDTWTSSGNPTVFTAVAGVTYDGATYGDKTKPRATLVAGAAGGASTSIVNIAVSNVTLKGFNIDGNQKKTSALYIGMGATTNISGITIDNCVIHDNGDPNDDDWVYGLNIGAKAPSPGITISNVSVTNTEIYNTGHECACCYASWGYPGNVADNVLFRNVTVHNAGVTQDGAGTGFTIANGCSNVTIEHSQSYDNVIGIWVRTSPEGDNGYPDNFTIRYNIIRENSLGFSTQTGINFGMNGSIYGNLFYNNSSGDLSIPNDNYNPATFNIYNNTFYNTVSTTIYGVVRFFPFSDASEYTPTINFKNNIIYSTAGGFYDYFGLSTHSDNLIYRASDNAVYDNGSSYTSAQITNWDETAIGTNPAFSGGTLPTGFSGTYGSNMVPNTDYFQLTVDSDAKDAGATLASYTGAINGAGLATPIVRPLGAAFDIGAYEYGTVAQSGGSAGSGFKLQGVTIR